MGGRSPDGNRPAGQERDPGRRAPGGVSAGQGDGNPGGTHAGVRYPYRPKRGLKYKTPVILQYFHDLTIPQIAEIMECNENTVKSNIRRAKKKLYDILKEEK